VAELSHRNFKERLIPVIYKEAAAEIAKYDHKVLLSGSFRAIVEPVSKHLGFDALLCSELETVAALEGERDASLSVYTGNKLCVGNQGGKACWRTAVLRGEGPGLEGLRLLRGLSVRQAGHGGGWLPPLRKPSQPGAERCGGFQWLACPLLVL
jgi:hypothetical protein